MALDVPAGQPAMPQGNGSTSSLNQPHIPGQYPSSTPTYEHNYNAASLEGGAPNGPLTNPGHSAVPATDAKAAVGATSMPDPSGPVEPAYSSGTGLGQEQYSIDPVLLKKSMDAAETHTYKASVPNNPNFHSRFVEDLPESIHSRDDDRVNSTIHLHEPVVGEGEIPAALASRAQVLAMQQASSLPPADPEKDHKAWDDSALQQHLAQDERDPLSPSHQNAVRPEAHNITSTDTVHNAPFVSTGPQLDTVKEGGSTPAASQHYSQREAYVLGEPTDRSATPSFGAQAHEEPHSIPATAAGQDEASRSMPQQQDPEAIRAQELAMVAPATVTVSAAALEQLSPSNSVNQGAASPGQSRGYSQHPSQLQPGSQAQQPTNTYANQPHQRQHHPTHMVGMYAPARHSQQYAPPQNQHMRNVVPDSSEPPMHHTPSQRKGPPGGPVLMSGYFTNGEPTAGPNKMARTKSRNSAITERSTQQENYRDSVFNSMSGVPDPTVNDAAYKPNQSLGQNRSLRSVFGAPIGMDDQRASPRSTPRTPHQEEYHEGEEEEAADDGEQPLRPAVLPRSKSQRTNRTNSQREGLSRSQTSASRRSRKSVAPSVASRRSTLPESWWSKAPEGANKRNGPMAFQVEKIGILPCSWWEKPRPAPTFFDRRNSGYSHHYRNEDDEEDEDYNDEEADSSDSDGPAPSRTYSTAGGRGVQRRKSLLPESYWSDKPKPTPARRSTSTRSRRSSRPKSRVAYAADAAEEDSADEENRAPTPRAPSRAASQRSRKSQPPVLVESATPKRASTVRSNRTSIRHDSRPASRAASRLTKTPSRRESRAPSEHYDEDEYETAGLPSRTNSRRSKADTMGQPSTATGFSSVNTSRSRLAREAQHTEDEEYDEYPETHAVEAERRSYVSRPRTPITRGEEPYTAA